MFKLVHPRWDPVKLHDWFNLVVIGLLNVLNITYMATGSGFPAFWTATMLYFLFDIVYVGIYPQSVKSPVVIMVHHILTALYIMIPAYYPQYHWCMSACMLVEANTWLLIARRCIGGKLVEAGFYATWVGLRNLYYPYLIWAFYKEWRTETALCGSPWNPILLTPLCQALLSGLNYYWTIELLLKVAARRRKDSGGAGAAGGGKGGGKKQQLGTIDLSADARPPAVEAAADVRAVRDVRRAKHYRH